MPQNPLRDSILECLRSPDYRPMNKSEFARALEVPSADRAKLRRALIELEVEGVIHYGKKGRYDNPAVAEAKMKPGRPSAEPKPLTPTPVSAPNQLRGSIKFTPKGDAWFFSDLIDKDNLATGLDLEKHGRLYVARSATGTSLDGDRVLISLLGPTPSAKDYRRSRKTGGRTSKDDAEVRGKVEQVLERRSGRVVGTYTTKGKKSWVRADDLAVSGNIDIIGDSTARPGQIVVVHIEDWKGSTPRGRIIEVLGWPDEAGVDILSIINRNGIRTSFPEEVLKAARATPERVDPGELKRREDWRDRLVITIDPADAKDHDDAIWVTSTDNGWQVAIHIADVSHYVKPGTSLDKEAIQRGNSTYLVDRVIPMLPVELSNGICSLKPDVDRLTKCAILDVNRQGKVFKSRFCDAVINSQSKLSYEQAQAILDGKPAPEGSPEELVPMVKEAWAMASKLRKLRFDIGALDLEMPEIRVKLNDKGQADRVEHVIHTESHQLVEECMLAANEAVAHILKIRNKPTIYRIHEDPEVGRLQEYGETAKAFGYNFGDLTNKKHIQQLLDAAKGEPDEHAIKIGLLKSLKRAAYSPNPLGHYGLSKGDYCHFTSPIRRYADLVVHRGLQPFLDNPPKVADKTPKQVELAEISRHISDTERASADSENESKNIKLLEYLDLCSQSKEPVIFEGLITDVRSMGLMVEATDISTRGVIKREDIPGGPWRFEQSQSRLTGSGGRQYQMGQRIQMEVSNINHELRFVDFKIAGAGTSEPRPPRRFGRGTGGGSSAKASRKSAPKAKSGTRISGKPPASSKAPGKQAKKKTARKAAKSTKAKPLAHKRRRK